VHNSKTKPSRPFLLQVKAWLCPQVNESVLGFLRRELQSQEFSTENVSLGTARQLNPGTSFSSTCYPPLSWGGKRNEGGGFQTVLLPHSIRSAGELCWCRRSPRSALSQDGTSRVAYLLVPSLPACQPQGHPQEEEIRHSRNQKANVYLTTHHSRRT